MRVALTGAEGFLGWHVRLRLFALRPDITVVPIGRANWHQLSDLLNEVDAVIQLAGINRADEAELRDGNVQLARDLLDALARTNRPRRVVYANSIQAGNATPYGDGKLAASQLLTGELTSRGVHVVDVRLPNLFGEHGRPRYNSFVATFVEAVLRGETPSIQDRSIELLHVQGAAQALLDGLACREEILEPEAHPTRVLTIWETLQHFHRLYVPSGDLPDLSDRFTAALFSTYRAALFPANYPIALAPRSDERGRLVETVRCHGSGGQTFVSTTHPGVTRGEHFHLHKLERFVVLDGTAEIELRRMFTDQVVSFRVSGDEPTAIDMPMGWTHNITATGDGTLTTQFWTDSLFDPGSPDTYWEKVRTEADTSLNRKGSL